MKLLTIALVMSVGASYAQPSDSLKKQNDLVTAEKLRLWQKHTAEPRSAQQQVLHAQPQVQGLQGSYPYYPLPSPLNYVSAKHQNGFGPAFYTPEYKTHTYFVSPSTNISHNLIVTGANYFLSPARILGVGR